MTTRDWNDFMFLCFGLRSLLLISVLLNRIRGCFRTDCLCLVRDVYRLDSSDDYRGAVEILLRVGVVVVFCCFSGCK
jgi:hypothetical protein